MKKKLALFVGVGLICLLIYVYCSFQGNVVSKIIIRYRSLDYVEEKYSNKDFELQSINYNFKDKNYYALYASPINQDEYFSLQYTWFGQLIYDSHENIMNKYNTWLRLDEEYRKYVDKALESPDCPLSIMNINYGTVKSNDEMTEEELGKLVINQNYDIKEIGKVYGKIICYIDEKELSVDKACEYLLLLKDYFDNKDVSFYSITITLENDNGESINILNFLYKDIYEENLSQRVQDNIEQTKEYDKELDKQKRRRL